MYEPSLDIYNTVAVGTIVDANDPQFRGRIRVYCPDYGDIPGIPIDDIPWCLYVTPFGGMVTSDEMTRGPGDHSTSGSVAYGMWSIPKVGSQAVIMCLNGDPSRRIYIGCMLPMHAEHTLPHGRYLDGGPVSSTEQPIQPLHDNMTKAFGDLSSPEAQSRATDFSVTGLNQDNVNNSISTSKKKDEKSGYKQSRQHPNKKSSFTGTTFDSQVHGFTTPGFHALSMDDSKDNCRIRIRSACGHNIILDDTNERIYINSAEGNSWIEIDQDGTIDIYASQSVSITSDTDINLTAKNSIRMHADDIHLNANKNIKMSATNNIESKANNIVKNADSGISLASNKFDAKHDSANTSAKSVSIKGDNAVVVSSNNIGLDGSNVSSSVDVGMPSLGDAFNFSPLANLFPKDLMNRISSMGDIAKANMMNALPMDQLSNAVKSADIGSFSDMMANMSPDLINDAVGNIDPSSLTNMLPNMDNIALENILPNIDSGMLTDITNSMPSMDVGKMMSGLDSNTISSVMNKYTGDLFSNVPSDVCGSVLNTLPVTDIIPTLGSMSPSVLENLPTNSLQNLFVNNPLDSFGSFSALSSVLPNNCFGAMSVMDPSYIQHVISQTPVSRIPDLVSSIPSIKLDLKNQLIAKAVNMLPMIDTAGLLQYIPLDYHGMVSGKMSLPDLSYTLKQLPKKVVTDIMVNAPRSTINAIFGGMNGRLLNDVLGNIESPGRILSSLENSVAMGVLQKLPGGDLLAMMTHGDMSQLMNGLSRVNIGQVLNTFSGSDIMSIANGCGIQLGSLIPDMNSIDVSNMVNLLPMGDLSNIVSSLTPDVFTNMVSGLSPDSAANMFGRLPDPIVNSCFNQLDNEQINQVMDSLPDDAMISVASKSFGTNASPMTASVAAYPTRIPRHEPWLRSNTKSDTDMSSKYNDGDNGIGKDNKTRNDYWRR